jgi:hypothetical protein
MFLFRIFIYLLFNQNKNKFLSNHGTCITRPSLSLLVRLNKDKNRFSCYNIWLVFSRFVEIMNFHLLCKMYNIQSLIMKAVIMGLEVGGYEKRKSLCRAINCFPSTSVNIYQILINWSLAKTTFYSNIQHLYERINCYRQEGRYTTFA